MPKIDTKSIQVHTTTIYPPKFAYVVDGREKRRLGDAAGLTQFGVNLTRLKPGAASALFHWHESEDEFVYILEGEVTLEEGETKTTLRAGDAAGFKAGVAVGHRLVNNSKGDVVYLEIGTRAARDRFVYPNDDLMGEKDENGVRLTNKAGQPY